MNISLASLLIFNISPYRLRERPDPEAVPERLRARLELMEDRLQQSLSLESRLEQAEQRLAYLENRTSGQGSELSQQLQSKVKASFVFCIQIQ
jgi:hypothetical protein